MLKKGNQHRRQRIRKAKESMSTMCHPGRYKRNGKGSRRQRQRAQREQREQREPQSRSRSTVQQSRSIREKTGTFFERHGDGGWSDDEDDGDEKYDQDEDEMIFNEHDEDMNNAMQEPGEDQSRFFIFGKPNVMTKSNPIVDDAMNILYAEKRMEQSLSGGEQSDEEVVLFEEKENGKEDWLQQRSSAHAMISSFAMRNDMSLFGRAADPHTDRKTEELKSCRLDGESSWTTELEKTNRARVKGGLEQVLIKRAARRRVKRERLRKYE